MQFQVAFDMPNGNPAVASVMLVEPFGLPGPRWRIDRVTESPPKRKAEVFHKPDHDSVRYRRADVAGRFQYDDDFFLELLGQGTFRHILRLAWLKCRPPNIVE